MKHSMRTTRPVYDALRAHHLDPNFRKERLSYLFGTSVLAGDGSRIILVSNPPILIGDDCFRAQSGGFVALDPMVQDAVLARFLSTAHDTLINCHDHWFDGADTTFSAIDTADDLALEAWMRSKAQAMLSYRPEIGPERPLLNLSVVLDRSGFDARMQDGRGAFIVIDHLDVIGERFTRISTNSAKARRSREGRLDEALVRHKDFIPLELQKLFADVTFAVIGAGGLGSIVAEALVRSGARRLSIIDHDVVDASNLNRWQGGTLPDVGGKKAEILARRVQEMASGVTTSAVTDSVFSDEAESSLRSADVLVGCLDDDLARNFLNRWSVQYLTPYFDAGVLIRASEKVDFEHRTFTVIPGTTACAECSSFSLIEREPVVLALLDEVTSEARAAAGYVQGRPDVSAAASAYTLNMRASAELVTEIMNFFFGWRSLATSSYGRWQDGWRQRADRGNFPESPDAGCPLCGSLLGCGDGAELPRPRPATGRVADVMQGIRDGFFSTTANERK